MPRHSFPYFPFTLPATPPFPKGQTVYRPWVVTRLSASNGNTFMCFSWPDSGADQCVFPSSFAIALGLDPLKMKQQLTGGVGNSGNVTYYADLTIEMGVMQPTDPAGKNMSFVPRLSFKTYAGFTGGLDAQGIGLLGQVGLFENFAVTFDHKSRLFHIDVP